MKRRVKIKYVGFWDTFRPERYLIHQILNENYEVEITNEPDYIICSLFSNEHLNYPNSIKIFYTAENVIPDFNLFDYGIGFDEMEYGDRYIRIPNYIMNLKYSKVNELVNQRQNGIVSDITVKTGFCSTVVSNGNGSNIRDYIFDELSKYKQVASGGRYRNNIGMPQGVTDKLDFQKKYKFALAIENTSYAGYTTEKLMEAFAAGGIPIYWGDPEVGRYFNENAFINVMAYETVEDAIRKVIEVDQNEELYNEYVKKTPLIKDTHIIEEKEMLKEFILHIFEQPYNKARRRPSNPWVSNMERQLCEPKQKRKSLLERLKKG